MNETNKRTALKSAWAKCSARGLILGCSLLLAACATQQGTDQSANADTGSASPPSAMDHTYHGEAVKARARAIRALDNVDAQRKDLQQEERSFERPAEPTPRENP